MPVLKSDDLIEHVSRYDDAYYCTIQKIEVLPDIIRVFIDERGDNSFGPIQDPMTSTLGIAVQTWLVQEKVPIDGKFTISDPTRQYLGYLDFALDKSYYNNQKIIGFQYGSCGYSPAKLFRFDQEFIDKHNLKLS